MSNWSTRTATAFTLTAGLLIQPSAAVATEKATAAKPKPAIELGAPFANNAILQRQMPIPVWGWSKPGTRITVESAGQKKTATAGRDGKWMLKLDPHKASHDERELKVTWPTPRKSLWGLCADLGPAPSAEEIDKVRREEWANFPREDI